MTRSLPKLGSERAFGSLMSRSIATSAHVILRDLKTLGTLGRWFPGTRCAPYTLKPGGDKALDHRRASACPKIMSLQWESRVSVVQVNRPPPPVRHTGGLHALMSAPRFVESVLLAEFDIDKGSVLRLQYPEKVSEDEGLLAELMMPCLLYTSPSPRDKRQSRMPSSA